jgi:hypothetical protein
VLVALAILSASPAFGSAITIPYTFTSGTTIVSAQVNANFSTIAGVVNGNLDNSNLSAGANISLSKLNLTQTLLDLQSTGTTLAVGAGETGDTVERVGMLGNGQLVFGAGGITAIDVGLARSAAGTLQINNTTVGTAATNFDWASTPQINFSGIWGGNTAPAICGGRIYLTSGSPYADHATSSTVYFGPTGGNQSGLININGTIQTFSEVSLALGALSASTPYDIYANSASSTAVALSAVAWGGANTPPTRSTDSYGRLTKQSATNYLLVGSLYLNGSILTADSTSERFLSNVYNAVPSVLKCTDTTATWTATSNTTPSPSDNNTTDGVGRCSFMSYLANIYSVHISCVQALDGAGNAAAYTGFGINSTSVFTASAECFFENNTGSPVIVSSYNSSATQYTEGVPIGFNYLQRLEYGTTATMIGSNGGNELATTVMR